MLTKRIVPCLDIRDGRTVKGVNFVDLRDAGDAIELAKAYVEQRADELVFLDITATVEGRSTLVELVKQIAAEINIPFTVGGGINSVQAVSELLNAGADKISINSAAVRNPSLLTTLADEFGSQCVVLAVDAKCFDSSWKVFLDGGRTETELDALEWMKQAQELGAGEVLLTSMDHDGTKDGFAVPLTQRVSEMLQIPVIASGGAGTMQHFTEVFSEGQADAALAASIFHFNEIRIPDLKAYLSEQNISVRI